MSTIMRPPTGLAAPRAAADVAGLDAGARTLARLRWRCRRGMLENDLILSRFLTARGATLDAGEIAALERLVELGDNELWDLLSGRTDTTDPVLGPVVAALRAA